MVFLISGIAIGALCAPFRYRIFMTIAFSALLAVGAVLAGIILHTNPWAVVAEAAGSIVALQFTYVAVGVTHDLIYSRRLLPQVQTAIGEQLGLELEVPRRLPPKLSALVGRLPGGAKAFELSRNGDLMN
jgi:hypothetical protein